MDIRTFEVAKEILENVDATNDVINLFKNYSAKSDYSNIRLVVRNNNITLNTANVPKDLLTEIISLCQNYCDEMLTKFENL